jgi:hypothetical protein
MKATTIYFGTLATVIFGGSVALAVLHRNPEAEFIAACEDVLKERLKAPSTYRRIETTPVRVFDGSYDQKKGYDLVPERKAEDEATYARNKTQRELNGHFRKWHEQDPEMMEVIITSDAENGFGTPVRGRSICRDSLWTTDTNPDVMMPKVDGYSALDWSFRGL